jgi:acyl-[acyl-carrier-protein]-phospholipid O-acyltransferase / long-chain-fatty-acid--[acyl-carrier-protein] ligase
VTMGWLGFDVATENAGWDDSGCERVIVLHTLLGEKPQECLSQLDKSDLPPLWKPRSDQFIRVPCLPYLGTGKLDLES